MVPKVARSSAPNKKSMFYFSNFSQFRVSFKVKDVPTQKRASTWNIDGGYESDDKNQEAYPFRVIDAGLHYSLFVILKTNNYDIDYLCGGEIQGFKIGFHSPVDIPRGTKNFFNLSPKRAVIYGIEPRYTKTEAKVRKFDPHERQCYFNSERKLRFYRQYSRFNCLSECLLNYTLVQCGCVHFSMLRMLTINQSNCIEWYIL